MTARELILFQVDEAGRMLRKTFEGIDENSADFRFGPLMTPREHAEHLCICYQAVQDILSGKPATWEEYTVPDKSWQGLMSYFDSARSAAIQSLSSDDEKALKSANDFIVGHDHYHVGQMCAVRRAMDPNWDTYAIYS